MWAHFVLRILVIDLKFDIGVLNFGLMSLKNRPQEGGKMFEKVY